MRRFLLFLVLTIVVGVAGIFHSESQRNTEEKEPLRIEQTIQGLDDYLQEKLSEVYTNSTELSSLRKLWKNEGIGFVVYNRNKVVDWTTNAIPFETGFNTRHAPKDGIVKLKNSWYLCRTVEEDGQLLVAYALLRTNFDFQNRYVKNHWGPSFKTEAKYTLTLSDYDAHEVQLSGKGTGVFVRTIDSDLNQASYLSSFIWFWFIILLLMCLWYSGNWISDITSPTTGTVVFALLAIGVRVLMMWWELPKGMYNLELFGPTLHATSAFLPSLGDFILHLIVLALILLQASKLSLNISSIWGQRLLAITTPILLLWPVHHLLEVLVINSSFSLDLNSPFSLNSHSIFGLTTSFLILLNCYLAFRFLFGLLSKNNRTIGSILPTLIVSVFILTAIHLLQNHPFVIAVSGGLILGLLMLLQNWMDDRSGIYLHTPNIFAFSLIACILLNGIEVENELESRKGLARNINQQENPITEYLFDDLVDELSSDRKLKLALTTPPINSKTVLEIIHHKLGYDHWNRYQSFVDIFNQDGGLMLSDRERTGPNYFELQSEYETAKPTMSKPLRYVGHLSASAGYLARIEIGGSRSQKDLVLFHQTHSRKNRRYSWLYRPIC